MFAKLVKHLVKVSLVLILSVAKHKNTIQIHQNEIINVPMHNGVHMHLVPIELGGNHWPSLLHSDTLPLTNC